MSFAGQSTPAFTRKLPLSDGRVAAASLQASFNRMSTQCSWAKCYQPEPWLPGLSYRPVPPVYTQLTASQPLVNPPLSALLTILLNTFPGAGGRSSVEECEPGPQRALGSILSMLFGLRLNQHLGGAWCGTGAIQASCFVNPKAQHLQTGSHFPSDEGESREAGQGCKAGGSRRL